MYFEDLRRNGGQQADGAEKRISLSKKSPFKLVKKTDAPINNPLEFDLESGSETWITNVRISGGRRMKRVWKSSKKDPDIPAIYASLNSIKMSDNEEEEDLKWTTNTKMDLIDSSDPKDNGGKEDSQVLKVEDPQIHPFNKAKAAEPTGLVENSPDVIKSGSSLGPKLFRLSTAIPEFVLNPQEKSLRLPLKIACFRDDCDDSEMTGGGNSHTLLKDNVVCLKKTKISLEDFCTELDKTDEANSRITHSQDLAFTMARRKAVKEYEESLQLNDCMTSEGDNCCMSLNDPAEKSISPSQGKVTGCVSPHLKLEKVSQQNRDEYSLPIPSTGPGQPGQTCGLRKPIITDSTIRCAKKLATVLSMSSSPKGLEVGAKDSNNKSSLFADLQQVSKNFKDISFHYKPADEGILTPTGFSINFKCSEDANNSPSFTSLNRRKSDIKVSSYFPGSLSNNSQTVGRIEVPEFMLDFGLVNASNTASSSNNDGISRLLDNSAINYQGNEVAEVGKGETAKLEKSNSKAASPITSKNAEAVSSTAGREDAAVSRTWNTRRIKVPRGKVKGPRTSVDMNKVLLAIRRIRMIEAARNSEDSLSRVVPAKQFYEGLAQVSANASSKSKNERLENYQLKPGLKLSQSRTRVKQGLSGNKTATTLRVRRLMNRDISPNSTEAARIRPKSQSEDYLHRPRQEVSVARVSLDGITLEKVTKKIAKGMDKSITEINSREFVNGLIGIDKESRPNFSSLLSEASASATFCPNMSKIKISSPSTKDFIRENIERVSVRGLDNPKNTPTIMHNASHSNQLQQQGMNARAKKQKPAKNLKTKVQPVPDANVEESVDEDKILKLIKSAPQQVPTVTTFDSEETVGKAQKSTVSGSQPEPIPHKKNKLLKMAAIQMKKPTRKEPAYPDPYYLQATSSERELINELVKADVDALLERDALPPQPLQFNEDDFLEAARIDLTGPIQPGAKFAGAHWAHKIKGNPTTGNQKKTTTTNNTTAWGKKGTLGSRKQPFPLRKKSLTRTNTIPSSTTNAAGGGTNLNLRGTRK